MKIDVQSKDNYIYVEPQERIDSNTSPYFQKALDEAGSPAANYIINLDHVPYISSAGLRVVMVTAKACSTANGTLILCGLTGVVKEVFEISGFNTILTICPDVAAAEELLLKQ